MGNEKDSSSQNNTHIDDITDKTCTSEIKVNEFGKKASKTRNKKKGSPKTKITKNGDETINTDLTVEHKLPEVKLENDQDKETADMSVTLKHENKETEENDVDKMEETHSPNGNPNVIDPCGSVKNKHNGMQETSGKPRDNNEEKRVTKRKSKKRKPEPVPNKYPCTECSLKFDKYRDRLDHFTECHKEFICTFEGCDRKFKDKSNRNKHSERHILPPSIQCHFCAHMFKRLSELNQHINKVHTKRSEQKKYVCEVCLKVFYNKRSADQHVSVHTGEKNFTCPEEGCGKMFRYMYISLEQCFIVDIYPKDILSLYLKCLTYVCFR